MNKRSKKNTRRYRSAAECFDAAALIRACEAPDFDHYAPRTVLTPDRGRERFYHFRDIGAPVLAVAHTDYVHSSSRARVTKTAAGPLVTSGALDDRLGVYVITELLPRMGIAVDVLLTTDEEIGASTASAFDTDNEYNWIVSFDRGGTDVVMYEYETPELVRLVEATGVQVGLGSFSDICYLDHLGIAGLNWGVGYRDYHGPRSHAWLVDTFRMVDAFAKFYRQHASTEFLYKPEPRRYTPYEYADWRVEGETDEDRLIRWWQEKDEREYGLA